MANDLAMSAEATPELAAMALAAATQASESSPDANRAAMTASDAAQPANHADEQHASAEDGIDPIDASASDADAADTSDADTAPASDAPASRPGETYQDYVLRAEEPAAGDAEIRPERVFVPGAKEAIRLRPCSSELFLLTQLRDEAHRFAITHHRKRRGKRALHSALDDIPGVGPALKKTLLQAFGSVSAIVAADDAALAEIKGVGPALIKRLREALGGGDGGAG